MKTIQLCITIAFIITTTNGALTASDQPQRNQLARPNGYWTQKETEFIEFTDRTCPEDQREDWYQYTKYIAEPLCAFSNAGLCIVTQKVKNRFPLSSCMLTHAAAISTVSHTIPYQSINKLNKVSAIAATLAITYDAKLYKIPQLIAMLKNKKIIATLLATGIVKCADTYCARSEEIIKSSETFTLLNFLSKNGAVVERKSWHALIHALWHILAAYTAYAVLKAS